MSKIKFFIIKGWRIVSHDGTYEYIKTTYTVDGIDDVIQAFLRIGLWRHFKVDSIEPVYFWD